MPKTARTIIAPLTAALSAPLGRRERAAERLSRSARVRRGREY